MKIKIKGEMTLAELRQCLFEQLLQLEDKYAVRYSRDVTLYITFTNGFGSAVVCRNSLGTEETMIECGGPYRTIAEQYDF